MPNPIVWMNDNTLVAGPNVATRSNLAASPDGRYSLLFTQDATLVAGAVFNANGTNLIDPLTDPWSLGSVDELTQVQDLGFLCA